MFSVLIEIVIHGGSIFEMCTVNIMHSNVCKIYFKTGL